MEEESFADDVSTASMIGSTPKSVKGKRDTVTSPRSPKSPYSPPFTPVSKDSPRLAKMQATSEKVAKVAEMKEKWAKEKEEKLMLMNDRRSALQKFVTESSHKEQEIRKMRISLREEEEKKRLQAERDLLEAAARDKALQAAHLERVANRGRQESLLMNKEMMRQFREKEAELEIAMKEEEASFLAVRREFTVNDHEAQIAEEARRHDVLITEAKEAQIQREIDEYNSKARHEEDVDIFEFRKNLALHMAEKDREAREALKQQMIANGEVAAEDRKIDHMISQQKQAEHRDMLDFRRDTALSAAQRAANDKALDHEDQINRAEASRGDRKIDQLLGMKRLEEDRDIVNFRRECAMAKAAKDKADGMTQGEILASNALIAQENKKMDRLLEKSRQDEDKDILHYRYETATAKAAKDKADRDAQKQHLILKGEIAQGDRRIDEQSTKARLEEDRDVVNFRRDLAMHKAEKDKEDRLKEQQDMIAHGVAVQGGRKADQQAEKARQDEDRDVVHFRQELALHKAEKDREAREALKQQMIANGEVAAEDRKIDHMISQQKQAEHRDMLDFRRDTALSAAQRAANDKALDHEDQINRAEASRGDRKIDQLLGMKRLEEDRDIVNFRRECAMAKAAKDKADGMTQGEILASNALIAQENKKMDRLLEKSRQDEDKDILHYRYETATAKAAKDKADRDAQKQHLILKGEIAQGDRRIDEKSAKAKLAQDRDAVSFRRNLALNASQKAFNDKANERREMAARGAAARLSRKKDQEKEEERRREIEDITRDRYEASLAKADADMKARISPKKTQAFFF